MARSGEKNLFQARTDVWEGSKIPIADTFGELAEMGFVDYGGYATFSQIQDAFRDHPPSFPRGEDGGRTNGGNGKSKYDFGPDCSFLGRLKY